MSLRAFLISAGFALVAASTTEAVQDEPETLASIPEIQGSGARSPLVGRLVSVDGVVTAFAHDARTLWIQSEPDDDPARSEGLAVRLGPGTHGAQVGDLVRVRGTVREIEFRGSLSVTTLVDPSAVDVLRRDLPLPEPAALRLHADSIAEATQEWERHEGMRVRVAGPVVAATDRHGEFAMVPRSHAVAGSGFSPELSVQRIRALSVDRVDYNPERILVTAASAQLPLTPELLPGDELVELTGVVDYSHSNYKIVATAIEVDRAPRRRWPVSTRSGPTGDLVITSFNVENLFDLADDPAKNDESSTPDEATLETKLCKLVLALRFELALPPILVLQEVENRSVLQELATRVNVATGTTYRAHAFGSADGRGIENAFLIDARRVRFVEGGLLDTPAIRQAYAIDSKGREPARAVVEVAGRRLTLVGNHFKSKGGDDALFGARQPPMRRTEITRKAQARALRSWLDAQLQQDPEAWIVVAGDLNDFPFAEPGEGADHPVGILVGEGERALHPVLPHEDVGHSFTYVYQGNAQILDHVLVSPALRDHVAGVDVLHFNATWPARYASLPHVPMRCSDHDPVELRLRLDDGDSGGRLP